MGKKHMSVIRDYALSAALVLPGLILVAALTVWYVPVVNEGAGRTASSGALSTMLGLYSWFHDWGVWLILGCIAGIVAYEVRVQALWKEKARRAVLATLVLATIIITSIGAWSVTHVSCQVIRDAAVRQSAQR